jgi:adenylate cyclase
LDDKQQARLQSVDAVLAEVREQLQFTHEAGDIYELQALQLLLNVVKAMHSEQDIYTLVTMILDSVLSFAGADRAFLMLLNLDNEPRFKMGRSYDGAYLTEDEFVISRGVVEEALNGQQPVILADTQDDPYFSKRDSILKLNLRTVMVAPLMLKNRAIGLIYADSKRPLTRYNRHHFNVLSSLADQAAVAISNAQKFETHHG